MQAKLRQVYARKGIVHVCWKGKLYAPQTSTTAFLAGQEVKAAVREGELNAFTVYVDGPESEDPTLTGECWVEIEIESKPRAKKSRTKPVDGLDVSRLQGPDGEDIPRGANVLQLVMVDQPAAPVMGFSDVLTRSRPIESFRHPQLGTVVRYKDVGQAARIREAAPDEDMAVAMLDAWQAWQQGARFGQSQPFEGISASGSLGPDVAYAIKELGEQLVQESK